MARIVRINLLLLGVLILSKPVLAVNVATETTQIMNNIQLAQHSIHQIQGLMRQAEMIRNQIEQLKSIATFSNGQWNQTIIILRQLDNVIRQGRSISVSMGNLDQQYRQVYPGYVPPLNFSTQYKDWTETTNDGIVGALTAANLNLSDFQSESAIMSTLQAMSDSAVGQTQAIQAGNMMLSQVVGQLQKLRQLMGAQIQAQTSYHSLQVNTQAGQEATSEEYIQEYEESNQSQPINIRMTP